MKFIMPLAALLGFEVEGLAHRAKSLAMTYAVIAILGLIGFCFLVIAGYIALAQAVGMLVASLILAGVFLALALAVYIGAQIGENRRQRLASQRRHSSETGAFLTTAALTALPVVAKSPLLLRFGIPAALVAFLLFRDKDSGPGDR